MNGIACESCGNHVAAYWIDFHRSGVESFAVCWICMVDARRGPRPPAVTMMTAGGVA
jgi:hypothetical protein